MSMFLKMLVTNTDSYILTFQYRFLFFITKAYNLISCTTNGQTERVDLRKTVSMSLFVNPVYTIVLFSKINKILR